jgi:uncharacterized protein (TIGR02453 family)
MVHPTTLEFLRDLAQNNNRDWFHENKKRYATVKGDFENVVSTLLVEINKVQELGATQPKDCIFRINRDIRFSKDKSPYKQWFSAAFGLGGRHSGKVDFYIHLQPGNETFLGAGMWSPTPPQLAKYRQEVDYNAEELKTIIHLPEFRGFFPEIQGETTKTAPRGYPKDHPEIELLRHKQLFFSHYFTDHEVLSENFVPTIMKGVVLIKPFCDFLNYIFFDEPEGV